MLVASSPGACAQRRRAAWSPARAAAPTMPRPSPNMLIETRLGVLTASAAPSVASLYRAAPDAAGHAVPRHLAVRREPRPAGGHGQAAQDAGALAVGLVNADDSPLARDCATSTLPLRAGPERSVAATKSYHRRARRPSSSSSRRWTDDEALADALAAARPLERSLALRLVARCVDVWRDAKASTSSAAVPGFGVAQEAALKFKETCGLHAEAFSAAEVRHGPMALVGPDFPLLVSASPTRPRRRRRANSPPTSSARGAPVFIAGGTATARRSLPVRRRPSR